MKFRHWISLNGVLHNVAVYRSKYLKRRIMYSYGHPGSVNHAVITNKEAHMMYGNMNKEKQLLVNPATSAAGERHKQDLAI